MKERNMKDIFSVDYRDAIRVMVRKELKNKYGLKIPKINVKDKYATPQNKCKYFGASLENMPSKNIKEDHYFSIPIFLVDAFDYLKDHLNVEGLFRKSGSKPRQNALRELIEIEGTFSKDEHYPHDIASLVKQFFRELPNPLFTSQFSSVFYKCFNLLKTGQSSDALFLCTLLLPDEHLRVLKFLVEFINEVGNHSLQTKMSLRNLGIVFAPNLVYISSKDNNNEKLLLETSELVDNIFKNPDKIGMVPENIMEKATSMDDVALTSSGDEIDEGCRRGRSLSQTEERKRERSKSITKFLRRGFKSAERKSNNARDVHGAVISPRRWVNSCKSSSSLDSNYCLKVDNNQNSNESPIRKSPRLEKNNKHPTISLPVLKTIPNQTYTPRNKLQSVDKLSKESKTHISTPVLPSKFDMSRGSNRNASSSAVNTRTISTRGAAKGDQNIPPSSLPQSRINRHTQKPHVRKSRRASSVDRRRARYQGSPGVRKIDNSPATPFTDENLTVNIAFMEDSNLPLNVDALSFENNVMNSPHLTGQTKIPRWKVKQNSTPISKNLRNKSISNPDIKNATNRNQNTNVKSRGRKI